MTTPTSTESNSTTEDLPDIQGLSSAESSIVLTDAAAAKVKELLEAQEKADLSLRVAARPGGCSGLQYQLFFDDEEHEADSRFELNGIPLVVDHMSGPFLSGAKIDFVDSVDKQGFTIDNPNAAPSGGSCGCGSGSGGGCGSGGHGGGGGCGC